MRLMGSRTILVISAIEPHAGEIAPADREKSRGIFVGLIGYVGHSPSPSKYGNAADAGDIFGVDPRATAAAPSKG